MASGAGSGVVAGSSHAGFGAGSASRVGSPMVVEGPEWWF